MTLAHTPNGTPINDYVPSPLDGSGERLLTLPQVAQRLSVSASTVRTLIARGDLTSQRIGRSVRVPASSVAAYIDGRAAPTPRMYAVPAPPTPRTGKRPYNRMAQRN
jgi:excisionase family DNA binding protein